MRTEEEISSDMFGSILSEERMQDAIKSHNKEKAISCPGESVDAYEAERLKDVMKFHKDGQIIFKKSLDSKKAIPESGESIDEYAAKRLEAAIKWHKDRDTSHNENIAHYSPDEYFWENYIKSQNPEEGLKILEEWQKKEFIKPWKKNK